MTAKLRDKNKTDSLFSSSMASGSGKAKPGRPLELTEKKTVTFASSGSLARSRDEAITDLKSCLTRGNSERIYSTF